MTILITALVCIAVGWFIGRGMLRDQLTVRAGFAVSSAILRSIEIAQRAYCSDEDCKCERCLTAGLIEKDLREQLLAVDGRKALEE